MEKKTFILVHGSWHSAWNWHKVTPLLEKQGHTVHAIDLPGMGRDKTPIQQVTFEKTVRKLCALIDSIEGEVILIGRSKDGIVVSRHRGIVTSVSLRRDQIFDLRLAQGHVEDVHLVHSALQRPGPIVLSPDR